MPPIDGATFEDRRSASPGSCVQVDGGADAGEAGADDETSKCSHADHDGVLRAWLCRTREGAHRPSLAEAAPVASGVGEASTVERTSHPFAAGRELEELAPGVALFKGFVNVTSVRTGDGVLLSTPAASTRVGTS